METKSLNKKQPLYYGWAMIALAALLSFFSGPGQTYSISMFIDTYVDQMEWSRSLVSAIYSVATLFAGLTLPLIGKRLDKVGHRIMSVTIALSLAFASLWMSFVSYTWMLAIGFYMMRLFGQGSMSLLASTLIPKWFYKRRGFALSLMALGGVAGSTFIPMINASLILHVGAAWAWRFWSVLLVLVMSSVAWIFLVDEPAAKGMSIEDENRKHTDSTLKLTTTMSVREVSYTLKQAMQTRAFWLLLFTVSVPAMINTGFTFHMVSLMEQKLLTLSFAAMILSITAVVQFPTTFIAGYILDRFSVNIIRTINFGLLIVVMLLMIHANTKEALIIYAIFHGIFAAVDSVSNGVLWPNYYGVKYLGSIRSVAMMAMVIGSALGPLPFGLAYDYFGGYHEIILLMLLFPVVSMLFSWLSPMPKKDHLPNPVTP